MLQVTKMNQIVYLKKIDLSHRTHTWEEGEDRRERKLSVILHLTAISYCKWYLKEKYVRVQNSAINAKFVIIEHNRIPLHCVGIFFSLKFLLFYSMGLWYSGMFSQHQ